MRLDPQSLAIHKAYGRMVCEVTKKVLYAYYVKGVSWDDSQEVFKRHGISRRTFYEALKTGSVALYNKAKKS